MTRKLRCADENKEMICRAAKKKKLGWRWETTRNRPVKKCEMKMKLFEKIIECDCEAKKSV